MRGTIPPLPQYAFMAWYLVKHRDNFTFTSLKDYLAPLNPAKCCICTVVQLMTEIQNWKDGDDE
jgi:hypothetical protein